MKLYNKSGRGIIISRLDAVDGCRFPADDVKKERAYIDPETEVEVSDVCGTRLLGMYPKELKQMDKPRAKVAKTTTKRKKA